MAKIDIVRRAQIGRERRARTRSQLIQAARELYAQRAPEAVIVDHVVEQAGVAKGTFYIHFAGLDELQVAVADELAHEFDELLKPRRLATLDPLERIAAGCAAFLDEALRNPGWGALVARGAAAMPNFAQGARERLAEDIGRAAALGQLGDVAPKLAFELALGIVLQTIQAAADGRITAPQAPDVIAAILRAIGVTPRSAQRIARHVGSSGKADADNPRSASA